MKILLYVLLAFGVFCFFSCKRTEKEQLTFLMKEWTRKEILFHDRAVFTIQGEGGNLAASKIRNLECPSYEICLIDYGCGKFNRKIHIMEQYP